MWRGGPSPVQLSSRAPSIESTIAARLSRSIAFLVLCGVGAASLLAAPPSAPTPPPAPTPAPTLPPVPATSIVYRAYDPNAMQGYRSDPAVVRRMVNELLLAVTHQPDIASAWRSLVSPKDKVGIKISAAGGELFTTHRDVVNAIVDGLVAAGQTRTSIIVWDRSLGGIRKAGYTGTEGYQLRSIPPGPLGYDPKATISAPFLGNLIWGDYEYLGGRGEVPLLSDAENTSSLSHVAKIVTSEVTKIINVPVLSNSERNGLAGCLYNVTIPNIDNWRRFGVPPDYGASAIPGIYGDPNIGPKVVLNLMDGSARGICRRAGLAAELRAASRHALRQQRSGRDRFRRRPPDREMAEGKQISHDRSDRRARGRRGADGARECRALSHRGPQRRPVKAILKSVSRSFYLTIRFLPRPLREPIGLAYLLARATDTIADTAEIPAAVRLTNLKTAGRSHRREKGFFRHRRFVRRIRRAPDQPGGAEIAGKHSPVSRTISRD